jgi:hypothetical protein
MLSIRSQVAIVLAVVLLLCVPASSWAQTPQDEGQAAATASHEVPAALVEVPEGQSVVTYHNGEVTIKARNALLIDVLQTVCNQIGAVLDAPPDVDEQILAALGPAPPKEVLASLLSGSRFNYGTAGTADDPNALVRIIILPQTTDSAAQTTNGSDVQPSQDSAAQNQATEQKANQATEPQAGSTPTASSVQSLVSQVVELLTEGQAELAQMGGGGEEADGDMANLLKEAEAQIKASVAAEANSNAPPPVPLPAVAPADSPAGRSRHKRH